MNTDKYILPISFNHSILYVTIDDNKFSDLDEYNVDLITLYDKINKMNRCTLKSARKVVTN